MHTIWIRDESEMGKTAFKDVWKGDTLSRWFEFYVTIQSYTSVLPFGAEEPASVIPVEIKAPPCPDCVLTITHTGILIFMEERFYEKTSATGCDPVDPEWKTKAIVYRADKTGADNKALGCDWGCKRDGLVFESLAKGVCFKLELKDKATTNRVFTLERLTYGYNGNRVSSKIIFDAHAEDPKDKSGKTRVLYKSEAMEKMPVWDMADKSLRIEFKFLKLGAVQELMYSAHVKLCRLKKDATTYDNNCNDPVKPGDSDVTTADVGKDIKPGSRLLETSEYHRQRYLNNAQKTVVQQYTTEATSSGTGLTAKEYAY